MWLAISLFEWSLSVSVASVRWFLEKVLIRSWACPFDYFSSLSNLPFGSWIHFSINFLNKFTKLRYSSGFQSKVSISIPGGACCSIISLEGPNILLHPLIYHPLLEIMVHLGRVFWCISLLFLFELHFPLLRLCCLIHYSLMFCSVSLVPALPFK